MTAFLALARRGGWLLLGLSPIAAMYLGAGDYDESRQFTVISAAVSGLAAGYFSKRYFKTAVFLFAVLAYVVVTAPSDSDAVALALGGGAATGTMVLLSALALRAAFSREVKAPT